VLERGLFVVVLETIVMQSGDSIQCGLKPRGDATIEMDCRLSGEIYVAPCSRPNIDISPGPSKKVANHTPMGNEKMSPWAKTLDQRIDTATEENDGLSVGSNKPVEVKKSVLRCAI